MYFIESHTFLEDAYLNQQFANCNLLEPEERLDNGLKISLRTSIGKWNTANLWGDYHFAIALRKSLQKLGYCVTIETFEDEHPSDSNILIYLRGLKSWTPLDKNCLNIMWNISHPKDISPEEYKLFDHVFIASQIHTENLKDVLKDRVECLLQCSDTSLFKPIKSEIQHDVLFVGNSRKVFREVVSLAIDAEVDLSVYGSGWEPFLKGNILKANNVQNSILHHLYSGANIVLNDHWDDMREYGFISNRIFDVLACNATVVSDYVNGIEMIFGNKVLTYKTAADFKKTIQQVRDGYADTKSLREIVIREHTFDHRARTIHETIKNKI